MLTVKRQSLKSKSKNKNDSGLNWAKKQLN